MSAVLALLDLSDAAQCLHLLCAVLLVLQASLLAEQQK